MRKASILASSVVLAMSSVALANTPVMNATFDTGSLQTYQFGFTYGDSGVGNSQTNGTVGGAGVGGTDALVVNGTFTNIGPNQGFSGLGSGAGHVFPAGSFAGVTSPADIYYSFTIKFDGLTGTSGTTNVKLEAPFFIDILPGGDDDVTVVRFDLDLPYNIATGGFQTFTGNFGSASIGGGSLATFLANPSVVDKAQMTIFNTDGHNAFGFDGNNLLTLDNVELGVVPEPTTLCLLAGAGFLALRRRL
jgi:hypothetical protein